MFTGIITDVGEVSALDGRGDLRARLSTAYPADDIALGASIACAGVCLTVVDRGSDDGRDRHGRRQQLAGEARHRDPGEPPGQ